MGKRSSFDLVWIAITYLLVVAAFFGAWYVLAVYMWVWNPFGVAANLNSNVLATCEDLGLINCTVAPERTFANYKTDFEGEVHVFALAFVVLGSIASVFMWSQVKLTKWSVDFSRFYRMVSTEARNESEPYVSDDPQQEVTKPTRI